MHYRQSPMRGNRGKKVFGEVAGHDATVDLARQRTLGAAAFDRIRTAAGEHAAAGGLSGEGQFALEHDALHAALADTGRRCEQGLRVRMSRPREDRRLRPLLHHVPQIHHQHLVRDMAHHDRSCEMNR
jgi:hypothetical protein